MLLLSTKINEMQKRLLNDSKDIIWKEENFDWIGILVLTRKEDLHQTDLEEDLLHEDILDLQEDSHLEDLPLPDLLHQQNAKEVQMKDETLYLQKEAQEDHLERDQEVHL